jgi:hypothetical protein
MDALYEEMGPISHAEAESSLSSGDCERIARTLVALGLHSKDWRWVQEQCLGFLRHHSELVVSAAILALGHTARVNRSLDTDIVTAALQALATDARYTGKVQDTLDDIGILVRHHGQNGSHDSHA